MRIVDCEQGSREWHEIRRGKITGTRLEQAFKASEALKNKLISERMTTFGEDSASSKDMQRGKDLEPMAGKEYVSLTGATINHCGFILHPNRDDFGLSPDGVIGTSKGLEIKCPNSQTHVEYIRLNSMPKKYLFQGLSYFLNIPTLDSLDFVSYDERNEVMPIHIVTLTIADLLNIEYLKGKKVESMDKLEDKVFSFADSVSDEYNRIVF